jgi:glycosyltransferase involved in cell wall biosynthesis
MADRTLTTLHGRQDCPDLKPLYLGLARCRWYRSPLTSGGRSPTPTSSRAYITAFPLICTSPSTIRAAATSRFSAESPEKRPDRAIRIAQALGIPLKIAAKVDKVDEAYFREKIAPLLSDPGVEFIGEIDERSKTEFLGEAQALLFPIDWPEPFGLVMIEAMACGTPVLASRQGFDGGRLTVESG